METRILSFDAYKGVGIVQLATSNADSFNYISLATAIEKELLEIREVSESGDVNLLFVNNLSDEYIYVMDGDILSGAKQNRIVNTSMLFAPHQQTKIPVSCVERGRWTFVSDRFRHTDYIAPSFMRSSKTLNVNLSLKSSGIRDADQGKVWADVDAYQDRLGSVSSTSNLSDSYEQQRKSMERFADSIAIDEEANGIVLFVGKRIVGLDIFNRREIYAEYFPKILRSIGLESLVGPRRGKTLEESEAKYRSVEFIDKVVSSQKEEYHGAGVGIEKRFEFASGSGFILEFNKHMIHLAAMSKNDTKPAFLRKHMD